MLLNIGKATALHTRALLTEYGDMVMVGSDDGTEERRTDRKIAGTVRLMTRKPIEIRAGGPVEQNWLAARLEQQPWLVALAILGLSAALLMVRRGVRSG